MDLYNEVKSLWNISEKAFNIFWTLKHTMIFQNNKSKDILLVFKTKTKLQEEISAFSKKFGISNIRINKELRYIQVYDEVRIYYKTINEISTLDGFRFKDIIFSE